MVFQAIFVGRPRVSPQELEILEAKLTCGGVNYTMTGYLSDSHLLRLYRQSSVALLFSEYEGLGYPILEAQAVGVPVVTSDSSSLPELNLNAALIAKQPCTPQNVAELIFKAISHRSPVILKDTSLAEQAEQLVASPRLPNEYWTG